MVDTAWAFTLTRSDSFTSSFDVYARAGGYPIEDGDGIYVGNATIQPWQTSTTLTWTAPGAGDWKFIAVPRFWDRIGPYGRLT